MESYHKVRHEGARWKIIYGDYSSVEAHALNELNKSVQTFHPYVVETVKAGDITRLESGCHHILIGTKKNNRFIARLIKSKYISLPNRPEGYAVKCMKDPFDSSRKLIVIAGEDGNGVLYGAMDFGKKILEEKIMLSAGSKGRESFDKMAGFELSDYPRITNRGIWTWGYAIYDHQRFFDNMAKLKMNMVVIWNDLPPVNVKEVIEFAHSRGIKVILGFPWGWGFKADLSSKKDRDAIKKNVIRNYKENYKGLNIDGVYFQTLTETNEKQIKGKSIALWATMLVNEISRALFSITPSLYLQFGLHATSIMDNFKELKKLDKRNVIMWEDAGLIPYHYSPVANRAEHIKWNGKGLEPLVDTIGKTQAYSRKLSLIRGKSEFAMVPKGWTCIDWDNEFEHHGSFILGQHSRAFISKRLKEKEARWNRVNEAWVKKVGLAAKFYRELLKLRLPVYTVTGLIEDGLFEEKIQLSVSIFSETLWNPVRRDHEILAAAKSWSDK